MYTNLDDHFAIGVSRYELFVDVELTMSHHSIISVKTFLTQLTKHGMMKTKQMVQQGCLGGEGIQTDITRFHLNTHMCELTDKCCFTFTIHQMAIFAGV